MQWLHQKSSCEGCIKKVGPSATPWALGRCPGCQGQVAVRPTRHLTLVNGASQRSDCQNGAVETYPTSFIDEGQTLSALSPFTQQILSRQSLLTGVDSPYVSEWVQIYLFEQNEQWIKHYLLLFGLWLKEHPFPMLYVPHLIIIIVLSEYVLPDQHISFASYNFVFCTPIEWSCSRLFRWDGCTTWVLFGRYVSEVWLLPLSSLPLAGNKQRNFLLFYQTNPSPFNISQKLIDDGACVLACQPG